jgi:ABC-type multidrug transport system fused ATPase/permease subunit
MAHLTPVLALQNDVKKHRDTMGGNEPFVFKKNIELNNVSFAYDTHRKILQGISMQVKRGSTIGLVGESGGGKTTIADLLLGLFKPTAGTINIDGVDISNFKLSELRSRIGYVSQDIFLKNDTVENNIRFYNDSLIQEDIETAAEQAHIYDTIMALPKGFDTIVGERGTRLSGGQRQRIVLARVLARRPDVLILDEATSSLDNESEAEIKKTLLELRGNITMIIIAHRLTTVKDCDQIFVLKDGRIAESGTPSALLQDVNSLFYKMQNAGE